MGQQRHRQAAGADGPPYAAAMAMPRRRVPRDFMRRMEDGTIHTLTWLSWGGSSWVVAERHDSVE
jgi:hypothetical protein